MEGLDLVDVVMEDETDKELAVILKIASPVFKRMLEASTQDASCKRIKLEGKSGNDFDEVMEFVHPVSASTAVITDKNVDVLLVWCNDYEMLYLKAECETFLMKKPRSVDRLLQAHQFSLEKQRKRCLSFVAENYEALDVEKIAQSAPEVMVELLKLRQAIAFKHEMFSSKQSSAQLPFSSRPVRSVQRNKTMSVQFPTSRSASRVCVTASPVESAAPSETVIVGGLPSDITESEAKVLLSQYGWITSLALEEVGARDKRSAIVSYTCDEEAMWIVHNLNGRVPQGLSRSVTVRYAQRRGLVEVKQQQECGYGTGTGVRVGLLNVKEEHSPTDCHKSNGAMLKPLFNSDMMAVSHSSAALGASASRSARTSNFFANPYAEIRQCPATPKLERPVPCKESATPSQVRPTLMRKRTFFGAAISIDGGSDLARFGVGSPRAF
eukprot:TRINITY_DN21770_c0_g1_i1.p1 TRINITY_DN21770_c0_g1~~TRINITY_DN21770_c0_g1_i1.p1  ORF type:complete len:439 (+),score=41.43 TRINITY_DN21770_c0_g1_i1:105-1421(+)